MSDTAIAQSDPAPKPATWLRVLLIVIAAIEGLEGLFKIPLAFDPPIFAKGWGGIAVGANLVLTLPFALVALFFLIKGDVRRGLCLLAGISLLRWIALVPSAVNNPAYPGTGFPALWQVAEIMIVPLLMLLVIVLAWKNQRLTLAGILAPVPALADWLGMAAFAVVVMIYGF
jgi:hypothetical protein